MASTVNSRFLNVLLETRKDVITRTMSSTSKKHRNFVSEPIGNKPVTDLAGVGPVLGQRLEAAGYEKVIFSEYTQNTFFIYNCCCYLGKFSTRSVLGFERESTSISGMDEGNVPGKFDPVCQLLQLSQRVV